MFYAIISVLAAVCYLAAGFLLWRRLVRRATTESSALPLFIGFVGVFLHFLSLYDAMYTGAGINLGFSNATSLVMGFIALIFIITALSKPVENLGIVLLPLAAALLVADYFAPVGYKMEKTFSVALGLHILFSVLAYAMLTLAAVQAVLLSVQDKQLHNHHPGGVIRALPPLVIMESLLFQFLAVGFVLQSLSLLSGALFVEDLFAQHLVHKTVLSIIAWLVFAILLFGHWRYGWRGQTATRWTLSGFFALLLAYFGSKYVLEIILGR